MACKINQNLLIILCCFLFSSCRHNVHSNTKFVPKTAHLAVLEKRDIDDEFELKLTVIDLDNNLPSAWRNLSVNKSVKLTLKPFDNDENDWVWIGNEIAFAIEGNSTRPVIDFSKSHINIKVLGQEEWVKEEITSVEVSQLSKDNIEVNFHIRLTNSNKQGTLKLGLSLNRVDRSALADSDFVPRKVGHGLRRQVSYFGKPRPGIFTSRDEYIKRFSVNNKKIVFYLEDFPEDMLESSKKAVEVWNKAFPDHESLVVVKVSEGEKKWGNRSYNVIRWTAMEDDLTIGVADPVFALPTGQVYSGNIQMNSTIYDKLLSRSSTRTRLVESTPSGLVIGGIKLEKKAGELPHIPFYSIIELSSVEAVQQFYYNSLTHEVGHVLGLDHNYMGSIRIDNNGKLSSVMDYGPRFISDLVKYEPGSYDVAAIQWGYQGIKPARNSLFWCGDRDLSKNWQCNQFDWEDPVEFLLKALSGFKHLLDTYEGKFEDLQGVDLFLLTFSSYKMLYDKFSEVDLPEKQKELFETEVRKLWDEIFIVPSGNINYQFVREYFK